MLTVTVLRRFILAPTFLLVGTLFILGGYLYGAHHDELASRGKEATATVEGLGWKERGLNRNEKDFKVTVRFTTADRRQITSTVRVSKSLGQRLRNQEPATVKVRYLPESPTTVSVVGDADLSWPFILGGGVAVLIALALFLYPAGRTRETASTGG